MSQEFGNLSTNAPIGQLQSMTVKSVLVAIGTIAVGLGLHFFKSWDDARYQSMSDAICTLIVLGTQFFAWYGRVRATKVIQTGAKGNNTAGIMLFLLSISMLSGCGNLLNTPVTPSLSATIYASDQAYTAAVTAIDALVVQKLITDKPTLTIIKATSDEIDSGLTDAETKLDAGDSVGAKSVLDHVSALLDKLATLKGSGLAKTATNKSTIRKSTTRATIRAAIQPVSMEYAPWTRLQLLSLSFREPKLSPSFLRHLKPLNPDRNCLPISGTQSSPSARQQRHVWMLTSQTLLMSSYT